MASMKKFWFTVGVEIIGSALVTGGVAFEICSGADIGYVVITSGAALVAFGGFLFAKMKPLVRDGRGL